MKVYKLFDTLQNNEDRLKRYEENWEENSFETKWLVFGRIDMGEQYESSSKGVYLERS